MLSDLPRPRAPRRESAMSLVGTRKTRSPRSIRNRSKDPETCRQSSSAHTRSAPRLARPGQQRRKALGADLDGLLAVAARRLLPTPRQSCASACACPHRARSSTLVHLHSRLSGRPADTACWGRCHAPFKSRRNIPDRRRATQRKVVRPNGRQPERESARRRSGPSPRRRTSPTTRIETASLKGAARAATSRARGGSSRAPLAGCAVRPVRPRGPEAGRGLQTRAWRAAAYCAAPKTRRRVGRALASR